MDVSVEQATGRARQAGKDSRERDERRGDGDSPAIRVPWTSLLGPRLGALERTSPLFVLFKTVIDPLAVALMLFALAYLRHGDVSGFEFVAGVVAFLLAGYILDGTTLFLGRTAPYKQIAAFIGRWLALLGIMVGIGQVSGTGQLLDIWLIVWWAVLTPLVLIGFHACACWLLRLSRRASDGRRKAVIVGTTRIGRSLAAAMRDRELTGLEFVGYFDDRPVSRTGVDPAEMLGTLADVAEYVRAHDIKSIYITLPMTSQPRIVSLLDSLRDTTASVFFVPDMFVFDLIQARFDHVGGIPVISVCDSPFEGYSGIAKRVTDVVLALLILSMIWPVMLAIAVAVKVTSPGPVIFKQRRYGLDGREIVVYKFRSMTVTEDGDDVRQAVRNDQRLTPIGGFLRATSLDELPQFINVLQGRMSIVGPRPHATAHNELYRKLIKGYMIRHKARPGITGWAQVNGLRGETDTLEKMERRIAYDLDYLRNWSVWLDIRIIVRTALMMFRDRNAY